MKVTFKINRKFSPDFIEDYFDNENSTVDLEELDDGKYLLTYDCYNEDYKYCKDDLFELLECGVSQGLFDEIEGDFYTE